MYVRTLCYILQFIYHNKKNIHRVRIVYIYHEVQLPYINIYGEQSTHYFIDSLASGEFIFPHFGIVYGEIQQKQQQQLQSNVWRCPECSLSIKILLTLVVNIVHTFSQYVCVYMLVCINVWPLIYALRYTLRILFRCADLS